MAGERTAASVAIMKRAIQDRVCLTGTHVEFRVRFAPHALGRAESGKLSMLAFEYGGLTLGRAIGSASQCIGCVACSPPQTRGAVARRKVGRRLN